MREAALWVLGAIALIMLMISAAYVDYQNPTWKANRMAYMNMIIHSCSIANNSISRNTFINCTACSNFNLVTNNNTATGMHFIKSFRTFFKVKGISANNTVGMNDYVITNFTMIINNYTGIYQTIFTNFTMCTNNTTLHQHSSITNYSSLVNLLHAKS